MTDLAPIGSSFDTTLQFGDMLPPGFEGNNNGSESVVEQLLSQRDLPASGLALQKLYLRREFESQFVGVMPQFEEAAAAIGGDVIALEADMSTPSSGRDFVEQATSELGQLDILVTNGGPPPGTFENTDLDAHQAAFDMNCRAMIETCCAAISLA